MNNDNDDGPMDDDQLAELIRSSNCAPWQPVPFCRVWEANKMVLPAVFVCKADQIPADGRWIHLCHGIGQPSFVVPMSPAGYWAEEVIVQLFLQERYALLRILSALTSLPPSFSMSPPHIRDGRWLGNYQSTNPELDQMFVERHLQTNNPQSWQPTSFFSAIWEYNKDVFASAYGVDIDVDHCLWARPSVNNPPIFLFSKLHPLSDEEILLRLLSAEKRLLRNILCYIVEYNFDLFSHVCSGRLPAEEARSLHPFTQNEQIAMLVSNSVVMKVSIDRHVAQTVAQMLKLAQDRQDAENEAEEREEAAEF